MAMSRIQFQPGLSMPEFLKAYGTEAQCEQALEAVRWPNGFCCPRCGHAAHYVLRDGFRKVFQCNACRHQASLIAGTVFQGTKLPLTIWFLAIYPISQAKTGLSALAIGSNRLYAGVQQFGASRHQFGRAPWGDIPARPFLGISAGDKADTLETVADFLAGGGEKNPGGCRGGKRDRGVLSDSKSAMAICLYLSRRDRLASGSVTRR
ncbi:MAG: transposase [Sulfurisoma sp.]|nr:transposase [Sulfurisoma sp.]